MTVKLGDLVYAESPHKKVGNYIVTHINKHNKSFRGVLVVLNLKDEQPLERTVLLPNCAHAILTIYCNAIQMEKVQSIKDQFGSEVGLEVEGRWEMDRKMHQKPKKRGGASPKTMYSRSMPIRITSVTGGGSCSPK